MSCSATTNALKMKYTLPLVIAAMCLTATTDAAKAPKAAPSTTGVPVSVADAKLSKVGEAKAETAIMKAVTDVENSLLKESSDAQEAARKACTIDEGAQVKEAPFNFHGRTVKLVEGCDDESKCGR